MLFHGYNLKLDHRNDSRQKSQWTISHIEEFEVFILGFKNEWTNPNQDTIWSICRNLSVLGCESQNNIHTGSKQKNLIVAKFTKDLQHIWHGYPISSYSQNDANIPIPVINAWDSCGIFPKSQFQKWKKGKI